MRITLLKVNKIEIMVNEKWLTGNRPIIATQYYLSQSFIKFHNFGTHIFKISK